MTVPYQKELDDSYLLTEEERARFRRDGYIRLKHIFPNELLNFYAECVTQKVEQLNTQTKPLNERNIYEKAFLQVMNIWQKSDTVRALVFSRRLAHIATQLIGSHGVRLYHDAALFKEPGGGLTPWHADQYYWPISSAVNLVAWIPLQDTPLTMGPLAFSAGSQHFEAGRQRNISADNEQALSHSLKDMHYPLHEEPFELGDVSFHTGWTFHRAGANSTDQMRKVMTMIYLDDAARLVEPKHPAAQNDRKMWLSGIEVGDLIDTPDHPLLYP